jgi:hypothetical protein
MTKEEALAYKEGYEALNAIEIEELKSMSDEEKHLRLWRRWLRSIKWNGSRRCLLKRK